MLQIQVTSWAANSTTVFAAILDGSVNRNDNPVQQIQAYAEPYADQLWWLLPSSCCDSCSSCNNDLWFCKSQHVAAFHKLRVRVLGLLLSLRTIPSRRSSPRGRPCTSKSSKPRQPNLKTQTRNSKPDPGPHTPTNPLLELGSPQ